MTQRRLAYTARLFEDLGLAAPEAGHRALLAVSACLGHAQPAHATPALVPGTPEQRRTYADRLIGLVTGP